MKFKILSRSVDTNRDVLRLYDNHLNTLVSAAGIPLCLQYDPRFERIHVEMPVENNRNRQYSKSKHLRQLRIQMGMNCNFNCKYCAQRNIQADICIRPDFASDVGLFVSRLKSQVETIEAIHFTGGEVFVYKKKLIVLVEQLKKAYPQAKIGIISNGSLLDFKLVTWLLKNKINLIISHDGPSFKIYRDNQDILENPEILSAIAMYIDCSSKYDVRLQFNIVVTPENSNLSDIPGYFYSKLHRHVGLQFESIVKTNTRTKDKVTKFDNDSANMLINSMLNAGSDRSSSNPLGYIGFLADKVVKRFVEEQDLRLLLYPCDNAQPDTLAVDLNGHILACQGVPNSISGYGSIEDLAQAVPTSPIPWTQRGDCRECPFLVSCLGGCSIQNDEDHEISCHTLRIWHMGLFYTAWFRMFREIIYEIQPVN